MGFPAIIHNVFPLSLTVRVKIGLPFRIYGLSGGARAMASPVPIVLTILFHPPCQLALQPALIFMGALVEIRYPAA